MLAALPARADHNYIGTADAVALQLTLTPPGGEPQGITIGSTKSIVTATPAPDQGCAGLVCASAAAAVEPFGETTNVVIKNPDGEAQQGSTTAFELPEPLQPLLTAEVGTATVKAVPPPGPSADADAQATNLNVTATQTIVAPLEEQVDEVAEQLAEELGTILEPLPDETDEVQQNVTNLLSNLVNAPADNPLATIELGTTATNATDSPKDQPDLDGVTLASAEAAGATVKILPVALIAPDGLFRVVVGNAKATARTNQQTSSASADGAIARLFVADLTTAAADYQEIPIQTGQPEQCGGQSPIIVCVTAGGGSTVKDDPKTAGVSAGAEAAAVKITAFADADDAENPLPGLTLALAAASAGVNSAPPGTDPGTDPADPADPTDPADPADPLPSTGGGWMIPGIAMLAAGSIAARGLRRRRTE